MKHTAKRYALILITMHDLVQCTFKFWRFPQNFEFLDLIKKKTGTLRR